MPQPEDSEPLPDLPVFGDPEWGPERQAWDLEVARRLLGYLSPDELESWIQSIAAASATEATQTYTTTVTLAAGAREVGVVPLSKSYVIKRVQLSAAARVRLYDTLAHRDADVLRPRGTDPDAGVDTGVMLDFALSGPGVFTLSPIPTAVILSGTDAPITVDNIGASPAQITVTITYLPLE
jgi:hypothetical protein